LSINPNKTVVTCFARKWNIKGLKEPILFSKRIQLSSEVKYVKNSWVRSLIRPIRPSGHAEAHLGKLED
jgi:hypothetical protein